MDITEYISFNLISFKDDGSEYFKDIANRDDIIFSIGLEKFINDLKDVPNKKTKYLKYWDELSHRNKLVLGSYEELIQDYYSLQNIANKVFNNLGHDCFIIRMKSSQINYLRQSDLEIEFKKISNAIQPIVERDLKHIDDKLTKKLNDLCELPTA